MAAAVIVQVVQLVAARPPIFDFGGNRRFFSALFGAWCCMEWGSPTATPGGGTADPDLRRPHIWP